MNFFLIQIILFTINIPLRKVRYCLVLLFNWNNPIKQQSFVYSQMIKLSVFKQFSLALFNKVKYFQALLYITNN